MPRRREIMAGGAALALAGLGPRRARAAEEVVVGVLYALSGASAQNGVDPRRAFETALDVLNESHDLDLPAAKGAGLEGLGGARIRLVVADHQGDPQKGRAEAERLIAQDEVVAIVGAYQSSVSAAVSAVCERHQPRLLLRDAALTGLTPSEAKAGVALIRRVAASGVTVIVVEHVMEVVMPSVDRAVVLQTGRVIPSGPAAQVRDDPEVRRAYLGI